MMAEDRRKVVDDLLEREIRLSPAAVPCGDVPGSHSHPSRLNAVWRQKVIGWYFTLIAALRRQHSEAAAADDSQDGGGGGRNDNPFDRASVHVTASLLDGYVASLPSERALRYKRDRPAYQLLATTCLLIGMRLAQHDRIKESRQRPEDQEEGVARQDQGRCGLKRAKAHFAKNMDEQATGGAAVATPGPGERGAAATTIPNASEILRISAAPKSMTEQHVLTMVREMTGSRSFPRSKVVTVLDFIRALGPRGGQDALLGPAELEEACRLADASLRGVSFLGCRPSIVACAAVTLSLARSRARSANLDLASLRQQVYHSIYGDKDDPALLVAIRMAESDLVRTVQVGVPSSLNNVRHHVVPTTHLIPLEDE